MYQTPLDASAFTWPRTYWPRHICRYALRHWRGCGHECAQQRRRALTSAPLPMRHFGGKRLNPLVYVFFSRLRRRQVLSIYSSAYHQFRSNPEPSLSLQHLGASGLPSGGNLSRHTAPHSGPRFFPLFSRARRVMNEEKNRIVCDEKVCRSVIRYVLYLN